MTGFDRAEHEFADSTDEPKPAPVVLSLKEHAAARRRLQLEAARHLLRNGTPADQEAARQAIRRLLRGTP
jgi:hypothetical protein